MERFTYLSLLAGWAAPVIALHWLVGARALRRHGRLLLVAVLAPTVYLAAADTIAISSGAWHLSDRLTLGLRWEGWVFEESLFFLLTNVMVAQSIVLFLEPEPRRRVWRWLRGHGSRRSASRRPDAATSTED